MIAKRGIQPRIKLWNLPCGFLESEEKVEDGAVREVFEETGAKVDIIRLHTIYNLLHEHQVYMIFLAKMRSPEFKTTPESIDIKLFKEEDVPWKEMAFTSSSFALKNFFDDRRNGNESVHFGTYDRLKR
jgi:ADP-ribose pyrophosphatase YjhB (NUDIX family)